MYFGSSVVNSFKDTRVVIFSLILLMGIFRLSLYGMNPSTRQFINHCWHIITATIHTSSSIKYNYSASGGIYYILYVAKCDSSYNSIDCGISCNTVLSIYLLFYCSKGSYYIPPWQKTPHNAWWLKKMCPSYPLCLWCSTAKTVLQFALTTFCVLYRPVCMGQGFIFCYVLV